MNCGHAVANGKNGCTACQNRPRLTNPKVIAYKVIYRCFGQGSAMKYAYNWQISELIKEYTNDPKVFKAAYNQVRRAMIRLGYVYNTRIH